MIRINLLATERSTKKKSGGGGGGLPSAGALQSYLLLALFAGGAAVLCAGAWWLQSNKLAALDTSIAADTKRKNDLEAIKTQVDEFQRKKATLENKVAVIEMLRAAFQSGNDIERRAGPHCRWCPLLDGRTEGTAAVEILGGP